MTDNTNPDKLGELLVRVERAWLDHGNRTLVHELGRDNPEHRDALYEFFDSLVLEPEDPEPEAVQAEDRVYMWLQSEGIDEALAAAAEARQKKTSTSKTLDSSSSSNVVEIRGKMTGSSKDESSTNASTGETWLAFLKRRTGQGLEKLAGELPNMNVELLVLISRNPTLASKDMKVELTRSIEERFTIPMEECLESLEGSFDAKRAANRRESFEIGPKNLEEEQPSLFNPQDMGIPAYVKTSDTSFLAAEAIAPVVDFLQKKVLDVILVSGTKGMTCDEVEVALDMPHQTASARINELMKDADDRPALLFDSGARRKTRHGQLATVWIHRIILFG